MAYVHIAHDCIVANNTIFSNGASIAGHVIVDDYAVLGGFTLVHQFCHIGMHSFCGMGSALNKDLPPYVIASGNLAKAYGLNKEGLRRRGYDEKLIQVLHKAYKELIVSKNPRAEQLEKIADLIDHIIRDDHTVVDGAKPSGHDDSAASGMIQSANLIG